MDAIGPSATLNWVNVALGLSFVLFNVAVATYFGLGIGRSLLTATIRCVLQLAVVALLLQKVFESNNPFAVAGIALLLNLLGTFEVVMNKSKRRYQYMFPTVFIGLLGSTVPVSIIGTRVAMSVDPFWTPIQYIPVIGMLSGNAVSGVILAVDCILKELQQNRDKVEVYLAFGASRMEACRPIAKEALRTALTPVINQMSVLGIIAIPGMMTGALLGGSSVQQASKLQMIIMFMLSSATTMASVFTTIAVIAVTVDGEHRIRSDRIDGGTHALWRARDATVKKIAGLLRELFRWKEYSRVQNEPEELSPLARSH